MHQRDTGRSVSIHKKSNKVQSEVEEDKVTMAEETKDQIVEETKDDQKDQFKVILI